MRFKFPFGLFKARPHDLAAMPQETFVDVMGENLFLRSLTFLLGVGIAGVAGLLAWQMRQRATVLVLSRPANVQYADISPPNTETTDEGNPAGVGTATTSATLQRAPNASPGTSVGEAALPKGEAPMPTEQSAPEPQAPKGEAEPKEDGLWELQEKLKKDATRAILEQTFIADGLRLVFKEAAPEGLVSFSLSNESGKRIYLPHLRAPALRSEVYMERMVLERNSTSAGIIRLEGLERVEKLELTLEAANFKARNVVLELPAW